eukprot:CAMPEP_0195520848 /NCGR_PEP_ID=MMETSP0794_2-20130614/17581_1 /TAXON_ID=515487 /ORGANISM="Stephanopyxis turris, Strain CCMP 815" /LENGTH=191 /DNA_ID=CAMNT_0040650283 /DNA_START=42 /DNA_END=617 /DNA_ORIENTATION=-
MALVTLALVGKDNEPMYMRDFGKIEETGDDRSDSADDDPFGFFSTNEKNRKGSMKESTLRNQFIVHSALDRFEELTGPTSGNRWRTPGATGSDAMWVGLLCPIEDLRVYGYLTNTNIKILAVLEDTFEPGQQQQARESTLKTLLANVHVLFVEYILNPFTNIKKSRIVSARFDEGVCNFVSAFNGVSTAVI